jgi:hypothetical protein
MRRVTIAVIGNAKTTRANLEALISDVVDSVDEASLVTVYKDTPSDGVQWATQYAKDKEILFGSYENNDYASLIVENSVDDIKFFMLWDDEDPECQLAASVAQEHRIPAYDLTNGLMLIPINSTPILRPIQAQIPAAEEVVIQPEVTTVEIIVESDEEPIPNFEPEDDDFLLAEEDEMLELFSAFAETAARVFARKMVEEFKRLINEQ